VIDGAPDRVVEAIDIWTFARNTRSTDPNWQLVETRTPD
jgi:predicted lipid-binding transport protein (Tim44 family)